MDDPALYFPSYHACKPHLECPNKVFVVVAVLSRSLPMSKPRLLTELAQVNAGYEEEAIIWAVDHAKLKWPTHTLVSVASMQVRVPGKQSNY